MGHGRAVHPMLQPAPLPGAAMSVSALVAHYGYAFVFAGALAEGESVLLAAGFAAHRGLLALPGVIAVAAVAGTLGDQIGFQLGRRHGARLLARWPALHEGARRVQPMLARHPDAAIVSVRFLYGLRIAGPIALGTLGVPPLRFALLNLLGAVLWALLFSALGYQFGNVAQRLAPRLHQVEEWLLLAVLLTGMGWTLWRRWRTRRRLRAAAAERPHR